MYFLSDAYQKYQVHYVRQILTPTVVKAVLQDEHKIAPKIFDAESLALAVKNSPASLES